MIISKLELFSALCLSLSFCANFLFWGIVIPALDLPNGKYGKNETEIIKESMLDAYHMNKPTILRQYFFLDFYIKYGGLIYYFLFIVLSTILVHLMTRNFIIIISYFSFTLIGYNLIGNLIKKLTFLFHKSTIVYLFIYLLSAVLFIVTVYNVIVLFL